MPNLECSWISLEPGSSSSSQEDPFSWPGNVDITNDLLLLVSEPSDHEWQELMTDNQHPHEEEEDETMRMMEMEEQGRIEMSWLMLAQQETREVSIIFPAKDVLVVTKNFLNPGLSWVVH